MGYIEDKCAPTLTRKSARRFMEAMEEVDRLPHRELPEDFFDEFEKFQEKSRRYEAEMRHNRKVKNAGKHEAGEIQTEGVLC